jgi:hypothetical protein
MPVFVVRGKPTSEVIYQRYHGCLIHQILATVPTHDAALRVVIGASAHGAWTELYIAESEGELPGSNEEKAT